MIHERYRIMGILDELVKEAMKSGASKIDISLEDQPDEVIIIVKDNGQQMERDKVDEIRRALEQPRHDEIEPYYHELLGQVFHGPGYALLGQMVDSGQVNTSQEGTTIIVTRRKQGGHR
ncbi:MAG: ATP-binding protein [Bacillota bacterium]